MAIMVLVTALEYPPNKTQQQLESPTAHRLATATSGLSATNGGPSMESGSASDHSDTEANLVND